ncbi:craniofacial development protein 2-like [Acyrthosiphon pisum]|uniref:Endonuclease/exonuclease/phosphatase domain-containing protein n=1 Tax=Acyrthosiphon pisum TaxID=7029 RepID=A0A8R2H885_ACYPI|nr:craniofacial development protein 2-like [Acyrthosiphon pisum]|eukprot:XP_016664458.1 PREDICTED: craniofacial development protein 2-like [Acyrthosiphon pisum]
MRTNGMTIFYSRSSNGKHENGVGFLVNDQLLPSIKKFTPVNDRICHIRIAERVYNGLSGYCLKVILGDFNSQVGRETVYRPTIGSESVHDMSNGNGTRLVEFAIANGLIVSSSFFPRKNINKYTWTSPRGIYKSQVDHVLVDKVHILCIKDVRSKRGADGDSYHFLVLVKLGIKDALDTHANRLEEQLEVQTASEIIKNSVLKVANNTIKQPSRCKAKQ